MSLTNPRIPSRRSPPPASSLAVIRIALLVGVLMFGAVTYYVQRGADWEPAAPDVLNTLYTVMLAVLVLAVVFLLVLRTRLGRRSDRGNARCWSLPGRSASRRRYLAASITS